MGMTPVPVTVLGEQMEARVKDNVGAPDGWHLWISLWHRGEMIFTINELHDEFIVPDIEHDTLVAAARRFAALAERRLVMRARLPRRRRGH
jgi:hypothetical protein